MTALTVLTAAREYLSERSRWCKGTYIKRDSHDRAIACCAVGAIRQQAADDLVARNSACHLLHETVNQNRWDNLPDWNDAKHRTHKQVLAAFDKAIELAKAQP